MNVHAVMGADVAFNLPDRFQKRQRFNIAYRSANFSNDDIGIRFPARFEYMFFNFVCHMGNDLNRAPVIFTATFFLQDDGINFSRRHIAEFGYIYIDKPLIMAKVQIGFRPIFRDKNFTVLVWTHCPRINVNVWIKFLNGDIQSAIFQKRPREAAVIPLPNDDTTPPVTKMYFVMIFPPYNKFVQYWNNH